jgi:hypothetical protein
MKKTRILRCGGYSETTDRRFPILATLRAQGACCNLFSIAINRSCAESG